MQRTRFIVSSFLGQSYSKRTAAVLLVKGEAIFLTWVSHESTMLESLLTQWMPRLAAYTPSILVIVQKKNSAEYRRRFRNHTIQLLLIF